MTPMLDSGVQPRHVFGWDGFGLNNSSGVCQGRKKASVDIKLHLHARFDTFESFHDR